MCQDTLRRGFPGTPRAELVEKLKKANEENADEETQQFYRDFLEGNLLRPRRELTLT